MISLALGMLALSSLAASPPAGPLEVYDGIVGTPVAPAASSPDDEESSDSLAASQAAVAPAPKIESAQIAPGPSALAPAPSASAAVESAPVQAPTAFGAPAPAVAQSTSAPPASSAPAKIAAFDPVPREQVDSIARRLALVEKILRRHGRAYDYRVLTNANLEKILRELDSHAAIP